MWQRSILLLAFFVTIGCSDSNHKEATVPVKGIVLVKKQPAAGALVVFHPKAAGKENNAKPVATTKDDGTFVLTTWEANDGAPIGEYGVTIVWNGKAKESKMSFGEGGPATKDQLGGRYGDPRNPKFTETVKAGDNQFTFECD